MDTISLPLRRSQRPRPAGFSLVEVLVSIVVLSIGLLGMVGMQAAALQANREARLQSTAITLARELAEMIRGNNILGTTSGNNPYLGRFSSPLTATTPKYCLSVGTNCTNTSDIANAQMTEWLARVSNQLPGAQVEVCHDSAPYDSTGRGQWLASSTACDADDPNANIVIKIGWTRGSTDHSRTGATALEHTTDTDYRPAVVLPVNAGLTL